MPKHQGSLEDRIIELETALAMQDRTIEKLDASVLEQQRLIDKLEAGLSALAERVRAVSEPTESGEQELVIGR